jgi:general secretion pathway protein D
MASKLTHGETNHLINMMMKDASKLFGSASLLLASTLVASQFLAAPLTAQASPAAGDSSFSAEQERLQREYLVGQARESYYQGLELEKNGQHDDSGSYYRLSLDTLPQAERTAEERKVYADAFSRVCIHLAEESAASGGLDEANRYIDVATEYAPDHRGVKEMKTRLGDPEWYAPGDTRGHRKKVAKVKANLGQGEASLNLGEIDAADSRFYEVLHDDKYNSAARQGLERSENAKSRYLDAAYDHTRAALLDDIAQKWEMPIPDRKRLGGGPTGSDFSATGDSREDNRRKLDSIIIPEINLGPVNIRTATQYLQLKSTELDPEAIGVKFVLDEQNIAAADSNALNQQFTIRMSSAPLGVVLGYACELAGLRYNVERFAVKIVSGADVKSEQFFTKSYSVPPSFEKMGVAGESGGGGVEDDPFGGGDDTVSARAKPEDVLKSRGIPWPSPGASAFYNRGSSKLVVTNTQSNMELVDAFVESIQEEIVKQVEVRVKFLEIRQDNLEQLGFDWLLGGFGISSADRILAGGGTLGNSRGTFTTQGDSGVTSQVPFFETGIDAAGNPVTAARGINPVTGGLRSGTQAINGSALDALIADVPRGVSEELSPAPGIVSLAGIFTDPEFQVIMRGLSQHKSADLVTAPTIVTKSASKAKIEVVRELIYPVEFDPPELPQEVNTAAGGGVFPVTPAHPTTFQMRPTGVTLEVDPQVGPDNYTIELSLAPEVVEFDGFVNYGSEITAAGTDLLGNPTQIVVTDNRIDLPIFSTRRVSTNVTVFDGSTVALGGLIREDVQEVQDKVPIVGDLPYIGRLFRSNSEQHLRRNLVIFVSARLIDPAGNAFRKQLESQLESTPGE